MAKKLKTLAAERSLDMVELNSRQCLINSYAGKLNEIGEFPLSPNVNIDIKPQILSVADEDSVSNLTLPPQEFMECALFSDADTNTSLMCKKLTEK